MLKRCGTCEFYVKQALQPGQGECHAEPVQAHVVVSPQGPITLGSWPPTNDKNPGCGKHKSAIAVEA